MQLHGGSGSWIEDEEITDNFEKIQKLASNVKDLLSIMRFQIFSSALNLIIIVSYGAIFEFIAEKINDWENYRTDAEYDNGIVIKNFLFQV